MADTKFSLTTRFISKPERNQCDKLLEPSEIIEIATGFAKVLEGIGPKLASCVEVVKVIPWKSFPSSVTNPGCQMLDVTVIVEIIEDGETKKLESSAQVLLPTEEGKDSLAERFARIVTASILSTAQDYSRRLSRKVNHLKDLLPVQDS